MNAPTTPDNFKPFSEWTEDEMRDRADELHGSDATLHVDWDAPIVRLDREVVWIPAWIELCPWD
jgi:hypothetical protein